MTPTVRRYDLVIFDCDGVLVDSELIACRVVAECLSEAGFPQEPDDIRAYIGGSSRDMYARLGERFGRPVPDDVGAAVAPRLREAFEAELEPMTGVAALLERVRHTVCVASSSDPQRIRHSLGCTGLLDHFGGRLFSATMVARGKPAPDLFLHAADALAVTPKRCVVIEDSVPGVQAAVAAGMTVIGFTGGAHCRLGHAGGLRRAGARDIARSMPALGAMLGVRP
jgi:HAD superfamily hydrolase (TIGR01509 family)